MDWRAIIIEPASIILDKTVGYAYKGIAIAVILIVGWFVAKAVEKIVIRFLKIAQLDVAADKAGVTKILVKGEIKHTLSELVGALIYWIIILIVAVAAVNALNLTVAAALLQQIIAYLPNVVAAIFVLAAGMFLASFTASAINTVAINSGIAQASLLSKIAQSVIVVLAVIMALEQLRIATTIINLIIPILLASAGLALGLAFGLGGRDAAAKIIKEALDKARK
ncbi:MAG: hypothetical protein COW11_05440 [Candidatus Omnitrophica bacterium CG12_big_fil_rev_8_21_14_0_65_43_15]|uniref:Small-conductance mechanosensitive ion channel n=1 Tax=Candidatus Taenaricola geysiri TaxID=1974752 RepID=A0A2J0LMT2_9BACT|nr:MAG: hypothetical protein AUJ89_05005 [Candidatus Omnitrophica bacterium CG1_02_43_210]PIR65491.1 MAG: hypothetical protein COU52_03960 [Candidatus Omnitrophica bacterium CG10_big_fil_rev_8_21_14_0_10_43_8]PIV11667.1 MAG: hypothetical protein COS48_04800 [Candidatus Omnitrophica bacterium CG03_land_8_20_14_0_80_43_22]PIW66026.1 MAG: hypothetical protein COW11_05440 [Candidatus Omnitrophica bacterium CG12_big_fil_rev_8_21_14_0_65_43_15]PIW80176.1 MAG: hypothetical protein COZ98_03735 [Candida